MRDVAAATPQPTTALEPGALRPIEPINVSRTFSTLLVGGEPALDPPGSSYALGTEHCLVA